MQPSAGVSASWWQRLTVRRTAAPGDPDAGVHIGVTMNIFTIHLRRLTIGATVALVSSAALAGPAAADTVAFDDARGDMLGHGADIWSVRVVNDDHVRVRVGHDDLVRTWRSGSSLSVFLDTDRQRRGPELVLQGATYEGADYALLRADGWRPASGQTAPLRCGYAMTLDYARDTAAVRIDRSCLKGADGIRVAVRTGGDLDNHTVVDWLGAPRSWTRWIARD